MKTLGRVLVIVLAFAIMMGITYSAVSASSSSTNAPTFQRGGEGFSPNGEQREFRDEGRGGSGFGMIFGLLKNTIIVTVIVALVAFPKNLLQQRRRAVPVRID
jgi:hypothetical protein